MHTHDRAITAGALVEPEMIIREALGKKAEDELTAIRLFCERLSEICFSGIFQQEVYQTYLNQVEIYLGKYPDYAELNYIRAYFYENGMGVVRNESIALTWYEKAADLGLAAAIYRIACIKYKSTTNSEERGIITDQRSRSSEDDSTVNVNARIMTFFEEKNLEGLISLNKYLNANVLILKLISEIIPQKRSFLTRLINKTNSQQALRDKYLAMFNEAFYAAVRLSSKERLVLRPESFSELNNAVDTEIPDAVTSDTRENLFDRVLVQDCVESYYTLGCLFDTDNHDQDLSYLAQLMPVEKNLDQALKNYHLAAQLGSQKAMHRLAQYYANHGFPEKAMFLYRILMKKNDFDYSAADVLETDELGRLLRMNSTENLALAYQLGLFKLEETQQRISFLENRKLKLEAKLKKLGKNESVIVRLRETEKNLRESRGYAKYLKESIPELFIKNPFAITLFSLKQDFENDFFENENDIKSLTIKLQQIEHKTFTAETTEMQLLLDFFESPNSQGEESYYEDIVKIKVALIQHLNKYSGLELVLTLLETMLDSTNIMHLTEDERFELASCAFANIEPSVTKVCDPKSAETPQALLYSIALLYSTYDVDYNELIRSVEFKKPFNQRYDERNEKIDMPAFFIRSLLSNKAVLPNVLSYLIENQENKLLAILFPFCANQIVSLLVKKDTTLENFYENLMSSQLDVNKNTEQYGLIIELCQRCCSYLSAANNIIAYNALELFQQNSITSNSLRKLYNLIKNTDLNQVDPKHVPGLFDIFYRIMIENSRLKQSRKKTTDLNRQERRHIINKVLAYSAIEIKEEYYQYFKALQVCDTGQSEEILGLVEFDPNNLDADSCYKILKAVLKSSRASFGREHNHEEIKNKIQKYLLKIPIKSLREDDLNDLFYYDQSIAINYLLHLISKEDKEWQEIYDVHQFDKHRSYFLLEKYQEYLQSKQENISSDYEEISKVRGQLADLIHEHPVELHPSRVNILFEEMMLYISKANERLKEDKKSFAKYMEYASDYIYPTQNTQHSVLHANLLTPQQAAKIAIYLIQILNDSFTDHDQAIHSIYDRNAPIVQKAQRVQDLKMRYLNQYLQRAMVNYTQANFEDEKTTVNLAQELKITSSEARDLSYFYNDDEIGSRKNFHNFPSLNGAGLFKTRENHHSDLNSNPSRPHYVY